MNKPLPLAAAIAVVVCFLSSSNAQIGIRAKLSRPREAQLAVPAATFTVNLTTDESDISVGDGNCDVNSGTSGNQCTLRAALQEANATAALDSINFAIPVSGLQTIQVSTALLPTIVNPVLIDGYTQPGSSPNTLPVGNNAVLRVAVQDSSGFNGQIFDVTAGNTTIRGLIINGGPFDFRTMNGIVFRSNGSNKVEGCWFGKNADGTNNTRFLAQSLIIQSGDNNTIGGLGLDVRNVLTPSTLSGGSGHMLQNNYIGTDPSGMQVRVFGSISSDSGSLTVGGNSVAARNVSVEGFILSGSGNLLQNNYVGVGADGSTPLGPVSPGIYLTGANNMILDNVIGRADPGIALYGDGNIVQRNSVGVVTGGSPANSGPGIFIQSSNNVIGGTNGLTAGSCTGDCNRVAFNNKGVVLDSGSTGFLLTNNRILGNSIYSNTQLGIDLDNNGITLNDPQDTDIGANNAQNFPVITSAAAAGTTVIQGTLNSTPNRNFRLEFFHSPSADSSGYGEGQTFIGSADVTTDGSGNASYTRAFGYGTPLGSFVAATVTDLTTGDTSEFSLARQVQALPPTAASVTVSGRVLTGGGTGIRNVRITLVFPNGEVRSTISGTFGSYGFVDVPAGSTCVLTVAARQYHFGQPSRVLTVTDDLSGLDFVADR